MKKSTQKQDTNQLNLVFDAREFKNFQDLTRKIPYDVAIKGNQIKVAVNAQAVAHLGY